MTHRVSKHLVGVRANRGCAGQRLRGGTAPLGAMVWLLFAVVARGESPCTPRFERRAIPDVGSNGGTSALCDLDGDGYVDLVTGVRVLMGDGQGGFEAPRTISGAPPSTFDIVPSDFDGDGRLDLALGVFDDAVGVTVLFGLPPSTPGVPRFAPPIHLPSAPMPWHLGGGDVDGDGDMDFVAVGMGGDFAAVHMNNGDRTFSRNTVPLAHTGHGVAVADFDGDGRLDLTVGVGNQVSLTFGRGDGTFERAKVRFLSVGGASFGLHRLRGGDLDGDGAAELVAVGNASRAGTTYQLLVYFGDAIEREGEIPGEPSLALTATCEQARFMEIRDVNSDGVSDLVTLGAGRSAGGGDGAVDVLLGQIDPVARLRFVSTGALASTLARHEAVLAVGDIDDDAIPDIVVTTEGSGQAEVLLNDGECKGKVVARGDADGDGERRLTDAVAILRHLFAGESLACPEAGRVNGDDVLNVSDPIYLLAFLFLGGPPPQGVSPVPCGP